MTAADVWPRGRGVVPGNLSTLILGQTLPLFTTWAHTSALPDSRQEKKKYMAKILQNVDPQTNMSGKEMAVNQVEKMLETGTMEDVHNEAGLWIDYRRNKQVMNDAVPSVPKMKTLLML